MYSDGFTLENKSLVLRSRNGAVRTIIEKSGLAIENSEEIVLDGFTIRDIQKLSNVSYNASFQASLYIDSSQGGFLNCIFENLSIRTVISFIGETNFELRNCIFRDNFSEIQSALPDLLAQGGQLFLLENSGKIELENCTFFNNRYFLNLGTSDSSLNISHSIVWNNSLSPFILNSSQTALTVKYSCVEGGCDSGIGIDSNDPELLPEGYLSINSPYIGIEMDIPPQGNPIDLSRSWRQNNGWGAFNHRDNDEDNLPDSWEILHFGSTNKMGNSDKNDPWYQTGTDIYGETEEDQSGRSVSISANGKILAIGGARNNGEGIDSGHVAIYSLYKD